MREGMEGRRHGRGREREENLALTVFLKVGAYNYNILRQRLLNVLHYNI